MTQRIGSTALPSDRRASPVGLAVTVLGLAAVVVLALATGNGIYLAGALGFLVALLLSVVLHEAGHFLTARRYGMKATQFFVGFGPTLFSRRRGETEYGVKAVPAGGFVKIVGMTPLEEMEPGDEERAFYRAPVRQKVVVLAAGSTVHFLIAALLVVGGTFALGAQREQAPAVGRVTACVAPDPADPRAESPVGDTCDLPGAVPAPAAAAGLQEGDVLQSLDGVPVDGSQALVRALRAAPGREVVVGVLRDGQPLEVRLTPAPVERISLDDPETRETVGAIGVAPRPRIDTERVSPGESLEESGRIAVLFLEGIERTVTEKLGTVADLYSDQRDPEGFIGVVGAGRISGEVLASEETPAVKALSFVLLIASLNLFVGLFNLLPLLPLDGGHIAVAVFEGARDRLRRLRGYRGPFQRVDYNRLLPLTYGVAALFLVFTVALLGADLFNPIRIT